MNKNNLHYIALLLLILLIAGISLANMQSVTVNFLLVQFKLPLIILILLCVLLGAFVMTLVNFSKGFSLKKNSRALKSNWRKKRKKLKQKTKITTKKAPIGAFFMLIYLHLITVAWRLLELGVKEDDTSSYQEKRFYTDTW